MRVGREKETMIMRRGELSDRDNEKPRKDEVNLSFMLQGDISDSKVDFYVFISLKE